MSTSYNSEKILFEEHKKWFDKVLESNLIFTYILEIDGKPIGNIRFNNDSSNLTTKISYLIDPAYHGMGLGTEILKLGIIKYREENSGSRTFYGYVLKNNYASIRIFEKLQFKKISENESELKFEKTVQ
jgi:RimJ/RimL family protein N-acetyltransferase